MATGTHAARGELALLGALSIAFATLTLREASPHDAFEVISRLFWRSASARPPILLVVILVGWAGVVHCGQVAGLRLSRALGEGVLSPRIILRSALGLLDVILLCRLVPFVAQVVFNTEHFGRWCLFFDIIAYMACILLLAAPPSACCGSDEAGYSSERCKAHQRYDHGWLLQTAHGRASLLRTLIESLCAPFAPVTFWHVIVADYATSMAKALGAISASIEATCGHLTMKWVVSFLILSCFRPSRGRRGVPERQRSRRWRLHETAPPRRRRRDPTRVYVVIRTPSTRCHIGPRRATTMLRAGRPRRRHRDASRQFQVTLPRSFRSDP